MPSTVLRRAAKVGLGLVTVAALALPTALSATAAPAAPAPTVDETPAEQSSFTLPVIPDTQFYSRYSASQFMPRYGTDPFRVQTQWIVDNQEALNIPFAVHVGDVVDQEWVTGEWDAAKAAMNILTTGGVPYSVIPGNHDVANSGARSSVGSSWQYLQRFGTSTLQAQTGATLLGTFQDGLSSAYLFEAEGHEWISLALAWNASDDTIPWAQSILDAHPNTPVILSSHAIISIASDQVSPADWWFGELLWDRLIRNNDQIILTVNGHFHGSTVRTRSNDSGNTVYQVLTDYQMAADGGNGIMSMFEFDLTNDRIDVETISPWVTQKHADSIGASDTPVLTGPGQSYSLAMNFAERFGWEIDPADANNEDLSELAKKIVSEGWTGGDGGGAKAAAGDETDYIEVEGTVAHWRFGSVDEGVVDETTEIPDVAGDSPMYRNPIEATDAPDELDDVTVSHSNSAFYSADAGSICFADVSRNDPAGDRLAYISTEYGAPATMANLTADSGYTIEMFLQLDAEWTETNNRWSAALNRSGARQWAGIADSSDPGAGVAWLGISSLREYQFSAATQTGSSYTLWSGEIFPEAWHHVAIVNNPVADTAIMYVDGVPVLRNASTVGGMKAVESLPWMIGTATWNTEPEHGWHGCVGETRIVDRAISPSEFLTSRIDIDGNGANFSLTTDLPAELPAGSSLSEFAGTGHPGAKVAVVVDGAERGTATVSDSGSWAITLGTPVTGAGAYEIDLVQSIGTRSGEPRSATVTIGTPPVDPGEPQPTEPSVDDLTPEFENLITVTPSKVQAGTVMTVTASGHPNETVDVLMWSDPTSLGRVTLDGSGAAEVTMPSSAPTGAHRLAVYGADGEIIGWAGIEVTPSKEALASTGAALTGGAVLLALGLLGGGVLFVLKRRRETSATQ